MPHHVARLMRPISNRTSTLAALSATLCMAGTAGTAHAAPSAPGFTHTTPAPRASEAVVRPGGEVLSDAEAASRVRSSFWEPRSQNSRVTHTEITYGQLQDFRRNSNRWGSGEYLRQRITGNFEGTTDEILQWAAAKWGLPADVLRAVAVQETYWRADFVGDNGQSFGLMQIKASAHPYTFPASRDSVAFNVDYYAGLIRYYYDGHCDWMKNQQGGGSYGAGDLWGSIGAHYTGNWRDWGSERYASEVRDTMNNRTWLWQWF